MKTVIIHELEASNDITNDNGWENIMVYVALDHERYCIIDAAARLETLKHRLASDGWAYKWEDHVFKYDPDKDSWVYDDTED